MKETDKGGARARKWGKSQTDTFHGNSSTGLRMGRSERLSSGCLGTVTADSAEFSSRSPAECPSKLPHSLPKSYPKIKGQQMGSWTVFCV